MDIASHHQPLPHAVTVVIPTHRDRGFLPAALGSVIPQLQPGDEILIVANGCTTEYCQTLERLALPPVALLVNSELGVAAARNAGVRRARGEYVLFLDDDDLLKPTALSRLRFALDAEPGTAAACGGVELFHSDRPETTLSVVMPPVSLAHHELFGGPPTVSMGTGLFRRDAIVACGFLDQRLAPADDWALWLEIAARGHIAPLPDITLRYRFHHQNESRKAAVMALATLRVFRLHHARTAGHHRDRVLTQLRKLVGWHLSQLQRECINSVRARAWRAGAEALRVHAIVQMFSIHVRLGYAFRRLL